MSNLTDKQILAHFLNGECPQIECEKCAFTFLTNVYDFSKTHVLLEKRSYGLEYYCAAIHDEALQKVPDIRRIGVIDEEHQVQPIPDQQEIHSGNETDFRFIYLMEKLQHLDEEDSAYFDRCVKDLEWQNDKDRQKIIEGISKRYNPELAQDVLKLYHYYNKHKDVLAWDLHGDNLMIRPANNEIVILDPYTRKV